VANTECPEFAAIRRGDERAYEMLFRAWYVPLCHFAYRYTKNEHAAEDVVQQFLAELWINRETRRPVLVMRAYLFQSIRMRAPKADRTGIQRGRHFPESSDAFCGISDAALIAVSDDALKMAEVREMGRAIDQAVAALPANQRAAVRETADLLGVGRAMRQQLANLFGSDALDQAHATLRHALAVYRS
jgi:RNA polymerase sigma-70 factor (ECF subfamily)